MKTKAMARDVSRSEEWGPNFMLPLGTEEHVYLPPQPPIDPANILSPPNNQHRQKTLHSQIELPRQQTLGSEPKARTSLNAVDSSENVNDDDDDDDDHLYDGKCLPRQPWTELRRCCGKLLQPAYSHTYFFYRDRPPKQRRLLLNSPTFHVRDWFHSALILKWYYQGILILLVYLVFSGIFALLYFFAGQESIRGFDSEGDFLWLSIQTLTTVGYGRLEPGTVYTHLVGALNALVGILLLSLTSGLVFTVVSKPASRVVFAKRCVVEPKSKTAKGYTRLHIRFVNTRYSQLYDVNTFARLRMIVPDEVNGGLLFRSVALKLDQGGHYPLVIYGRSFYHVVDEQSPLFEKDEAWLKKFNASILVCFLCHDSDYNQTTACSIKYENEDICLDSLYVNLRVHNADPADQFALDVNNLDLTFNPNTQIRSLFQQLDGNGDGELSMEEMKEFIGDKEVVSTKHMSFTVKHLLQHFDEIDTDKNGYLSWPEFQAGFLYSRQHDYDHDHEGD